MNYALTEPCAECPFLRDSGFEFARLVEHASGEFACHKTCVLEEDSGNYEPRDKSLHCAGALIFNEKRNEPHQMQRICERLTDPKTGELFYDARKLNMDSNVGSEPHEYGRAKRRRR